MAKKKKRFTDKEKKLFFSIIFGFIAWSFLGDPIDKIINAIFTNIFVKLLLGFIIVGTIFYFNKH